MSRTRESFASRSPIEDRTGQLSHQRFYKNDVYHKRNTAFVRAGTYDGIYERSKQYFEKAAKHKDLIGVSKSYFGIANVHGLQGKKDRACEWYDKSLEIYYEAKNRDPDVRVPTLTGFKDMPKWWRLLKGTDACETKTVVFKRPYLWTTP